MRLFRLPIGVPFKGRSALATALAVYVLLFSSIALVHAYAQDEITDTHGCVIGAWVQHANATDASAPSLGTFVCLNEFLPSTHETISPTIVLGSTSRGPPLSSP
jgi:hypothetical protein